MVACFSPANPALGQDSADPLVAISPEGTFEFHADPWISLHHFAFHYVRERQWELKLRSRVPLLASDHDLISDRFIGECALLDQAYAPYLDSSLLFSPDTRALAKTLVDGPDSLPDAAVREALQACMPAYLADLWESHRDAAAQMVARLSVVLAGHEAEMVSVVAGMAEAEWPVRPIRVDISPYANWAAAYTDDKPPHITMSSQDSEMSGEFAFEMLFHESGHLAPLAASIDASATAALERAGIDNQRYPHYVLFYLTGIAAQRVLGDPAYVPFYKAQGLGDAEVSKAFYAGLEKSWEDGETLDERMDLALRRVMEDR